MKEHVIFNSKGLSRLDYMTRIGILLLVVLIAACSPVNEQPLRIGTNIWLGYEPLYLARGLGHYDHSSIKLVEFISASEVIHALRSGSLEGAALTLDESLTIMQDGFDLKVILVMDFSHGGDVLMAKPEITSLAQLRGKKVAIEYTAVGALLLDAALKQAKLEAKDIIIVTCELDMHVACYADVDALVTFEPVRTQLIKMGARILFDSSQIPGRIVDVLVVQASILNTHANSLRQLLAGYFKARDYLEVHPQDAAKRMSPRQQLDPSEILAAYAGLRLPSLAQNHLLLNGDPAPLDKTAGQLTQLMLEKYVLSKSIKFNRLSQAQFLPELTE